MTAQDPSSEAARPVKNPDPSPDGRTQQSFWPTGWWRLMETRIGIIPLPMYVLLLGVIVYFISSGEIPHEVNMMAAIIAFFGFTCAELGKRVPLIRNVGGAAIFATFVPSCLVYYHLIPDTLVKAVTDFTKSTNFLYLFIAAVIVGSILGQDRTVLIRGFLKIFVPLGAGSVAAAVVGMAVGTLLGMDAYHTFFFIIVPIMAGGVGEGAIPLSVGYAGILHQPQGDLFAQVLPTVMLGSLTAILLSGALNSLGKKYPHLTGEGHLQPDEHGDLPASNDESPSAVDISHIAAGGLLAITLYLLGLISFKVFGLPAPVAMLFLAVLVNLTQAASPQVRQGSFFIYKFFATAVTYPLLFAIGVSMTPWDKLTAAISLPNIVTIFSTVATLMATGFFVGRWVELYPIEAAIVNACHSGQGGTGDVAILTAANRMQLMPFAQIATRIGGGITVTLTLILMAYMH